MPLKTRSSIIWVLSIAFFFSTISPAESQGKIGKRLPPHEYGTVVMNNYSEDNQVAPVVFRHWVHRSKHTCRLCHVDIEFAMEAGQTFVREKDNQQGLYCGTCHNGMEAFGWETETVSGETEKTCGECHSKIPVGRSEESRDLFEKRTRKLPEGRFGNGIDWAEARRRGKIKPKDFIAGVSFSRQKMKIDNGDLSIDSKLPGMPDIVFSHKEHAVWNSCDLCHPDVFSLKAGATEFSMQDIFAGQFCGACHGKVAFPVRDCGRCHTKPVY